LAQLRRSEREVFTMCVWSGLGYAEAAAALGVPVGTVRSRLSRARTRLRKLADKELKKRRARQESVEPVAGGGQVPGGRTEAAWSNEERNR
jgi:RNA polymerase sigma-70 factor (ECF subfamily)